MKTIRILNILFLAIFLCIVHRMYQEYHERNEKIERENQLVKVEISSSFPVREAGFYLTKKDMAVPKKKEVQVQAPKEKDIVLPSTEDLSEKIAKDTISTEGKTVEPFKEKKKKVEKKIIPEKKENKVEISKAIVIEKKESPEKKPVEQPKKSAPVVTEIKEVKLPKGTHGGIQEIEGTFDPN